MNRTVKESSDRKITAIKRGGFELEEVIRNLYREGNSRRQVLDFVLKHNGNKEDAEDVFQEGIRALVLNLRKHKFEGESSLEGYLFGICRNIWFKKFQKRTREAEVLADWATQEAPSGPDPEFELIHQDREEQMLQLLGGLGDLCKQVLVLWRMSYSMREIATRMGYASEGMARKKKHQCMKRLLALIEENPGWESILGD